MGRLLLVDLGEDEERFEQFMMPLASKYLTNRHLTLFSSRNYVNMIISP